MKIPLSVVWIPILNTELQATATHLIVHCSVFCGLVGYDTISQRNTVPPLSFILNMWRANSSEIPLKVC
jgi:hypothetical protein